MNRNVAIGIGDRLRSDANKKPYRDTVWPGAIQFYRAFAYDRNDPAWHYKSRVLQSKKEGLDQNFGIGLFGYMRNGLSVLLLALAKMEDKNTARNIPAVAAAAAKRRAKKNDGAEALVAGSVGEEVRKLLCNYIACVALQFWLMMHERWMEVDPAQIDKAIDYCPPYIFYFHHNTDFTQSHSETKPKPVSRGGRKMKAAVAEDAVEERRRTGIFSCRAASEKEERSKKTGRRR